MSEEVAHLISRRGQTPVQHGVLRG
jgi:hypothetical protein